jgi:hypothetical protein
MKLPSTLRWPVRALSRSSAQTRLTYSSSFADKELSYEDKKSHLVALVQTYFSTMADLGAETWLMHGTLMGWWWNRKVPLGPALSPSTLS